MKNVWHYVIHGQRFGPVTPEELQQLAASKRIDPLTLVWRKGLKGWAPAGQVKGLFLHRVADSLPKAVEASDSSGASNSIPNDVSVKPPLPKQVFSTNYLSKWRIGNKWALGAMISTIPAILAFKLIVTSVKRSDLSSPAVGVGQEELNDGIMAAGENVTTKTDSKKAVRPSDESLVVSKSERQGKDEVTTSGSQRDKKATTNPVGTNGPITKSQRKAMVAFAISEDQFNYRDGFVNGFKQGKLLTDSYLKFDNLSKRDKEQMADRIGPHKKEMLAVMRKWRSTYEAPVKEYMASDQASRDRMIVVGCYRIGFLDGYMNAIESYQINLDLAD